MLDYFFSYVDFVERSCKKQLVQKAKEEFHELTFFFSQIWSTDFPAPRLGQGAFKIALDSLYTKLTNHELKSTSFGKPHAATYQFAEQVLDSITPNLNDRNKTRSVYAVGDNPAADIQGANGYGWTSVLVRTGVFTGKGNSEEFPAKIVCENVEEAVEKIIFSEEGKMQKNRQLLE